MTEEVSATLSLSVAPAAKQQREAVFELADDGYDGATPCRVPHFFYTIPDGNLDRLFWFPHNPIFPEPRPKVLDVQDKGRKRFKLYCSAAIDASGQVIVETGGPGDSVRRLGRRSHPVDELVSFSGGKTADLRYGYDAPTATVLRQTSFFKKDGSRADPPRYVQARGQFVAMEEVFGSLRVRYSPAFTLYEATYGNGSGVVSSGRFSELKQAWAKGNIQDTDIPPVTIFAFMPGADSALDLERKFSPAGANPLKFARRDDEDEELQEEKGSRESVIVRIKREDDPEDYIDVKRATRFIFKDRKTGKKQVFSILNDGLKENEEVVNDDAPVST